MPRAIDIRHAFALIWLGVFAIAAAGIPERASAGAFLNPTQSAGAASVSTAGETAVAEDATTIYYNAAGMTFLNRPQALFATGIVFPSTRFSNGGTLDALGNPVIGSTNTNPQVFAIPSLFLTAPLDDRFHVGLGLFMPFGQATKYDDKWVGRYQVETTALKTIDIDPAVAYRVSDSVSLGAGLDVQYGHIVRKNAIDFGSLCFLTIGPVTCPAIGLLPQRSDGRLVADLSDWSVGYNLGFLFHPSDATHIGVNYRSAVQHNFSGVARFDVPSAAQALTVGGKIFQDTTGRSSLTFPDIIALGLSQKLNDRVTMLLDLDWTLWSRVKQLAINFGNPLQPTQSQPLNWHDSIRAAVGGVYKLTNDTDLRAGISYDQSPIPAAFRTADLPDSDQITLSIGLTERFTDRLSVTISYSYEQFAPASLNLLMPGAGTLIGTSHVHSNSVGFQARLGF